MKIKTNLMNHQVNAVEKLLKVKVGALYMEMGTGKTRTALELINKRLENGKVNHVLWLCPCSVKKNLEKDLIKHTGRIWKNITICGIETLSSSMKENVRLLNLVKSKNVFVVVDESNLIKNHEALRTENIVRLSSYCKYKLILNGTPITKNYTDLYSQWYFLDYRILGYKSFWSFSANHIEYDENIPGKIRKCLNVDYLIEKIAPYSYQVKKKECLDLPKKTHDIKYCLLSKEQYLHYAEVADQLLFEVDEMKPHTIYKLFTGLQNVISGKFVNTSEKRLASQDFFKEPMDNPRICLMMEIADSTYEKMIIYCKYTSEIKIITELLNKKYGAGTAVPFFGEINQKKRQENKESFEKEAQYFVANKACAAYGLNLQFCSYIVYYSNDWDYGTRIQSEDRVHRIGQDKNVHIVDICAEGTLDEKIVKCLERKESLLDVFKYELDQAKDKNDIYSWIAKKDICGRKYQKKTIMEGRSELVDA